MRKLVPIWLSACLFALSGAVAAAEDFLQPDEAFRVSAAHEADRVLVSWAIADGYYLYRSKFRFSAQAPEAELGNPEFPPAETKEDPFFGEMEIYRDAVTVALPVLNDGGRETLALEVTSQGCADEGLCYPPHRQQLFVALPPGGTGAAEPTVATTPVTASTISASTSGKTARAELDAFTDELGLGGFDDDILPAEEAFRFDAVVENASTLRIRWDIADGTYLYADKIGLSLTGEGAGLGEYQLPPPKVKHDSVTPEGEIGDVEVYEEAIELVMS